MFAEPVRQLDDRAAGRHLVVQDDDVLAVHVADDGVDDHLVVGEPLLAPGRHRQAEQPGERGGRLGVAEVGDTTTVSVRLRSRKCSASSLIALRWSTGTEKKLCTCGGCNVIVSTRPAPEVASRSATSRAPMEMRGASFLSERA